MLNAPARRKEFEVTDLILMQQILAKGTVMHLGLAKENQPYVIPVNYVYRQGWDKIYMHTGRKGLKMDIIAHNNQVCFQVDHNTRMVESETSCACTMFYESVLGIGTIHEVVEAEEKEQALQALVWHFLGRQETNLSEKRPALAVLRIDIKSMTARRRDS